MFLKLKMMLIAATAISAPAFITETPWHNHFGLAMIDHYSWHRVMGYRDFGLYWQGTMQELSYKPGQSIYSFDDQITRYKQQGDQWKTGFLAFHQGQFDEAISQLSKIDNKNETAKFWLGLAHLRRGIQQVNLMPDDKLLTSEKQQQITSRQTENHRIKTSLLNDLSQAQDIFSTLAEDNLKNQSRHQWLLNVSEFLLSQQRNDTSQDRNPTVNNKSMLSTADIKLVETAANFGINTNNAGKGVAVEDFDRDGDLDIVTGGFYSPTHYYRNEDGQGFTDLSSQVGIDIIKGAHIITAADYDNDGWVDLLLSHPTGTRSYGAFSLLRNVEGKHFKDVTYSSGLLNREVMSVKAGFTWTSAWGDIDNDGDLDLFIAHFGGKHLITGRLALDSMLYRNDSGHFTDVSEELGLKHYLRNNLIVGATFGDYNNDGYADLALASMLPGFPMLFTNQFGNSFRAEQDVVLNDEGGFTLSFIDINHDGKLDLFRGVAMVPDDNIDRYMNGKIGTYGHSQVWLQGEDGRLRPSDHYFNDQTPMASMGTSFGDLNNDGAYEFYLGTGGPQPWFLVPNVLYAGTLKDNQPSSRLMDINHQQPVGTLAKGHGIVFFDFDNDGDQDIYSSLGGMWPGDRWPNEFFVNHTDSQNNWIKIRLRGRQANYYGLGAMLRVTAETPDGKTVKRYYLMDNKTGFGSAPYLAHIGLAGATRITDAAVKWPGTTEYRSYPAQINGLNTFDQQV